MKKIFVMGYNTRNIGDEIQTIATTDILDDLGLEYAYVDRDQISSHQFNPSDHNVVIMNGWFTNGYGLDTYYSTREDARQSVKLSWPPTGEFFPLAYSFCLSQWGAERITPPVFTSKESMEFYRTSPGFGCRDTYTHGVLTRAGLDGAYVSECLTLTLDPKKYRKSNSRRDLVFVDVPDHVRSRVIEIAPAHLKDYNVKTYTHELYDEMVDCLDRVKYAKRLLSKYANAALVVTTRLHVALPCLAFGTPCIFFHSEGNSRYDDYVSRMHSITPDGLDGLEELLTEAVSNPKNSENKESIRNMFFDKLIYSLSEDFILHRWAASKGFTVSGDGKWRKGGLAFFDWHHENGTGVAIEWSANSGGFRFNRISRFATKGEFMRAWDFGTAFREWAESVMDPVVVVDIECTPEESAKIASRQSAAGWVFGRLEQDAVDLAGASHVVESLEMLDSGIRATIRFFDTPEGNICMSACSRDSNPSVLEFFVNAQAESIDVRIRRSE